MDINLSNSELFYLSTFIVARDPNKHPYLNENLWTICLGEAPIKVNQRFKNQSLIKDADLITTCKTKFTKNDLLELADKYGVKINTKNKQTVIMSVLKDESFLKHEIGDYRALECTDLGKNNLDEYLKKLSIINDESFEPVSNSWHTEWIKNISLMIFGGIIGNKSDRAVTSLEKKITKWLFADSSFGGKQEETYYTQYMIDIANNKPTDDELFSLSNVQSCNKLASYADAIAIQTDIILSYSNIKENVSSDYFTPGKIDIELIKFLRAILNEWSFIMVIDIGSPLGWFGTNAGHAIVRNQIKIEEFIRSHYKDIMKFNYERIGSELLKNISNNIKSSYQRFETDTSKLDILHGTLLYIFSKLKTKVARKLFELVIDINKIDS